MRISVVELVEGSGASVERSIWEECWQELGTWQAPPPEGSPWKLRYGAPWKRGSLLLGWLRP